jgi:hypothetical protein
MIILEYHPDGICVPDVKAMETAQSFVEKANDSNAIHEVKFSQTMIFDAFRVLIKRGVVQASDVGFKFQDKMMYPDSGARLNAWPRGFCDLTEDYLLELM